MQKKTLHLAAADFQLKKKEKNKEEKEGERRRKKAETHGAEQIHGRLRSGLPPRPTAGSRRRFFFFFFFFFPFGGFDFFFGF
jgi:hypothetical protein